MLGWQMALSSSELQWFGHSLNGHLLLGGDA